MNNSWKAGIVLAVAVAIVLVFSFKPGSKRPTSPGASGSLPAVTEVAPQTKPEPQPGTPSPPKESAAREEDAAPTPPATVTRPDTASETASQPEPKSEETAFTEESEPERPPRFVEIGADKCIPCRMMQPILAELRQEYAGKLQVDMVDVWKHPEQADKYGIQSIPTQLIYDSGGKEVFRHLGFWPKDEILAKFKELGINLE